MRRWRIRLRVFRETDGWNDLVVRHPPEHRAKDEAVARPDEWNQLGDAAVDRAGQGAHREMDGSTSGRFRLFGELGFEDILRDALRGLHSCRFILMSSRALFGLEPLLGLAPPRLEALHRVRPGQTRDRASERAARQLHARESCKNRPRGVVPVVHQLRVYEIFDHNKAAFHARFRDHAMRIMKRYGFAFLGMWESQIDDQTEFVYLLEWPDVATKEAAWRAFLADEEWKEIKRLTNAQHGDLVGEIEDRLLVKTAYSPATATPGR